MFKAKLDHTLSPPTGTAPQAATMTRRAAIGTAMVLATPTLATLQAALASPAVVGADPILAAIEAHATATMDVLRKVAVSARLSHLDPRHAAAELATDAAWDAADSATYGLVRTAPTTLRGVLALLDHVERYDAGAFNLGPDENDYTSYDLWPVHMAGPGEPTHDDDGEPLGMPFQYWLLRNVRAALAAIGGAA